MNDFEKKMHRLKLALGLFQDQEVAQLLGLSKASMSARKRRNAFPDDRVAALVAQRPELDLRFVLTGVGSLQSAIKAQAEQLQQAESGGSEALRDQARRAAAEAVRTGSLVRRRGALQDIVDKLSDEDVQLMLSIAGRLSLPVRGGPPALSDDRGPAADGVADAVAEAAPVSDRQPAKPRSARGR